MSKKDYQAIAGAIYRALDAVRLEPHAVTARGGIAAEIIQEIAYALKADNSRFDMERFREACETGKTRGMRSVA